MPLCLPNYDGPILPCREVRNDSSLCFEIFKFCLEQVCERVRTPCEFYYTQYGFPWPDALKCEQYPSNSENPICMDPKKNEVSSKSPSKPLPNAPPSRPSFLLSTSSSCCPCNKSLGFQSDPQSKGQCLPPCHSPYFSDEQSKSIMNKWLTFLSLLCAISCAFVLLTFSIDITRFKYPQRPIIFLALCYLFISCGYLLRLKLGHENVACRSNTEVS